MITDNKLPLVSVVIPVYKSESVLEYCIKSVLKQSLSNFELILVDDGSPDDSGNICEAFAKKDARIRVAHKKNEGVSAARNFGIGMARGKYIFFVDSDDYIEKEYLDRIISFKEKNEDIDNVWCRFNIVRSYNNFVKEKSENKYKTFSIKDIVSLHKMWVDAMPWNKIYVTDIIKKNKIQFDETLSLGEDLLFNLEYLDNTNGKICLLDDTLYNYVITEGESLDNKYYESVFDIYEKIHAKLFEYAKKWKVSEEDYKEIYSFAFYKYEEALKNTFKTDNKKSKKEKYRYNNSLMRSVTFKKSLNNMPNKIHFLYRISYKTGIYRVVRFVDQLCWVKGKIFHEKNK